MHVLVVGNSIVTSTPLVVAPVVQALRQAAHEADRKAGADLREPLPLLRAELDALHLVRDRRVRRHLLDLPHIGGMHL